MTRRFAGAAAGVIAALTLAACSIGSPPPQVSPSVVVQSPGSPEVRIPSPSPVRPPQSPPAGAPAPD